MGICFEQWCNGSFLHCRRLLLLALVKCHRLFDCTQQKHLINAACFELPGSLREKEIEKEARTKSLVTNRIFLEDSKCGALRSYVHAENSSGLPNSALQIEGTLSIVLFPKESHQILVTTNVSWTQKDKDTY
jgi:hypothetical protein